MAGNSKPQLRSSSFSKLSPMSWMSWTSRTSAIRSMCLSPWSSLSSLSAVLSPVRVWHAIRAKSQALAVTRARATPWAALDISATRLTAVLVAPPQGDGRPRVLNAATADLRERSGNPPDEAQLASLAQQIDAGTRPWTLLLPRDEYRISVIAEPAVPAAELAQSVRWQVAPALDFAAEDASVDFMKIPTQAWQPERMPELYAIAARGDAVRQHAVLFDNARLKLAAMDIRETAQRNVAALAERSDELLVMVAFGQEEVQISFSWHHELYMDRLIAEATDREQHPERRAANNERIATQVQRSIEAVRGNFPFMMAARVLVAGAPQGFCELLALTLPEPVETLLPEALFDLSGAPELREPLVFMQHFHAIGAALRGLESHA